MKRELHDLHQGPPLTYATPTPQDAHTNSRLRLPPNPQPSLGAVSGRCTSSPKSMGRPDTYKSRDTSTNTHSVRRELVIRCHTLRPLNIHHPFHDDHPLPYLDSIDASKVIPPASFAAPKMDQASRWSSVKPWSRTTCPSRTAVAHHHPNYDEQRQRYQHRLHADLPERSRPVAESELRGDRPRHHSRADRRGQDQAE